MVPCTQCCSAAAVADYDHLLPVVHSRAQGDLDLQERARCLQEGQAGARSGGMCAVIINRARTNSSQCRVFMLRLQLANSIRAQKAVEEGDASAVAGGDHKLSAQRETVSTISV